jgi:hypothetical protein
VILDSLAMGIHVFQIVLVLVMIALKTQFVLPILILDLLALAKKVRFREKCRFYLILNPIYELTFVLIIFEQP